MKKAIAGSIAILLFSIMCLLLPVLAIASGGDDDSDSDGIEIIGGDGGDGGDGGEGIGVGVGIGHGGNATGGTGGNATMEGIDIDASDHSRTENNSTNVVLVPNNNTSNCIRVWGFSFGGREGAAALGIPTRDAGCDFEQAADDAAATGNHVVAWYWRCHKKNLYKTFKHSGRTKETAIIKCFGEMRGMISVQGSDEPLQTGQVILPEAEYQNLLLAQVQQEELDDAIEQGKARYAQQQTLIEELQKEVSEYDSEKEAIEKLEREEAERKAAELAAQQKFKERLAAKEKIK